MAKKKEKDKISRIETGNKFKAVERNAVDSPVKNIEWEGEQIAVESDTKIEQDKGTGQPIIIRTFEFAANPETFKIHKPTAQELFNHHRKGIESLLWTDELMPFQESEPRLMFSKNKKNYRFIIACIPLRGSVLVDTPQTLSQILKTK